VEVSWCPLIRAMSLVKSLFYKIASFWYWKIYLLMVSWIFEIRFKSSKWEERYKLISIHGCNGWLFIHITYRYGEMDACIGNFWMYPGKEYALCMKINNPPLVRVYGNLQCCIHLVGMFVMLKRSSYVGNRFCIYLVDLEDVIFVSRKTMMVGSLPVILMRSCRLERVEFRKEEFQVIIVFLNVIKIWIWCVCGGLIGIFCGYVYSNIGCDKKKGFINEWFRLKWIFFNSL
jgi:hypothetical protein